MKKYEIMKMPFQHIPPNEWNREQAAQYFEWFIEQTDGRIKVLQQYIEENNKAPIILDKTPGSLVSLWEWFQERIVYEKEDTNLLAIRVEKDKPDVLKSAGIRLSEETVALIKDISIYFAETMIHNNKEIHWGYRNGSEGTEIENVPILHGFKKERVSVNQNNLVLVCTLRSIKKKNCLELYEAYGIWKEYAG